MTPATKLEEENKELVRRFVNEVFNEGNLDNIEEYVSEDYVGHNHSLPEDIHGPDGYREFVTMLHSAFPDIDVTIEDLIAEGDLVVQRSLQSGTHEGEFWDIKPTGEKFDASGMVIYQIEDGKIVEEWDQFDMMGMMQQLGVIDQG